MRFNPLELSRGLLISQYLYASYFSVLYLICQGLFKKIFKIFWGTL